MVSSHDQLLKKQIEKQMKLLEKKAKVQKNDLKLLKFNTILMSISLIILTIGSLMVYYLFIDQNGINAYAHIFDTSLFDSTSKQYLFFIGSHFGAVVIGIGIFLFISSVVSFTNDYESAKKIAIDALIEIERQRAKKEKIGTVNIFDALALGARMK
jgi:hypothetical protein